MYSEEDELNFKAMQVAAFAIVDGCNVLKESYETGADPRVVSQIRCLIDIQIETLHDLLTFEHKLK